jgi:hypothetical protein
LPFEVTKSGLRWEPGEWRRGEQREQKIRAGAAGVLSPKVKIAPFGKLDLLLDLAAQIHFWQAELGV